MREFAYGQQYAWMLVIFTLMVVYCLTCPLVTPFGKSRDGTLSRHRTLGVRLGAADSKTVRWTLPLPPPSSHLSTTPLVEMSVSPQPSSALRFLEEVPSVRLPKIRLHYRLCIAGRLIVVCCFRGLPDCLEKDDFHLISSISLVND